MTSNLTQNFKLYENQKMNTSLQTKKEVNSVNMRLQTKNVFWKKYQDDAERCYIILEFSSKKGISPPKCYSTESYIQ